MGRSVKDTSVDTSLLSAAATGGTIGADKGSVKSELSKALSKAIDLDIDIASILQRYPEISSGIDLSDTKNIDEKISAFLVRESISKDTIKSITSKLPHFKKLKSGREVEFHYFEIANSDIADKTTISEFNSRDQLTLCEEDIEDILFTYTDEKGQSDPGYAHYDKDGNIAVFDGGRRRLSHLIDKRHPFKVYVTSEKFDKDDYLDFDVITEAKLPRSCVEQGRLWKQTAKDHGLTQQQLADKFNRPLSVIKENIGLASVGSDLLALAYSPAKLGSKLIKRIRKFGENFDNKEIEQLKAYRDNYVKENKESLSQYSVVEQNIRVVTAIEEKSKEISSATQRGKNQPKTIWQDVADLNIPKNAYVRHLEEVNARTSSLKFDLKNISPTKRESIKAKFLAALQEELGQEPSDDK